MEKGLLDECRKYIAIGSEITSLMFTDQGQKKSRIGFWYCYVAPYGFPVRHEKYLREIIIYSLPNLLNRLISIFPFNSLL